MLGVAEAPSELDRAFTERAFTEQAFAVDCDQRLQDVVRERIPAPPLRMQVRQDHTVIWVYASDQITVACHWAPGSRGAAAREPGLGDGLTPPGTFGSQLSALGDDRGWIVGWAPAGTRRVEVVLADGIAVPATLDGQLFAAAWESPGSERLKLVAYADNGVFTMEDGKTVFQSR